MSTSPEAPLSYNRFEEKVDAFFRHPANYPNYRSYESLWLKAIQRDRPDIAGIVGGLNFAIARRLAEKLW